MLPIYAERLKMMRQELNLTQIQVQTKTGINNKTLSGYEAGRNQPDFDTLKELCDFYNVTTDWVLGHTNNRKMTLTNDQRVLVNKVDLGDSSFMESLISFNGRELTAEEKKKIQAMAQLLLHKDQ
ncbi:helix-turn-helix domain-containing protein [Paenibacillus sp. NPDC058367]|uniref:helix-turn-helix domain-containing protein n=1 Tax=unclassified Paenibacillus TaxID=185978 RepID=UPI0030FAC35A